MLYSRLDPKKIMGGNVKWKVSWQTESLFASSDNYAKCNHHLDLEMQSVSLLAAEVLLVSAFYNTTLCILRDAIRLNVNCRSLA